MIPTVFVSRELGDFLLLYVCLFVCLFFVCVFFFIIELLFRFVTGLLLFFSNILHITRKGKDIFI